MSSKKRAFLLLLALQMLSLLVYTVFAIQTDGLNLVAVLIDHVNALGWSGRFNLEFRTNNVIRMPLMQSGNSTINGNLINRSGFLGLSTPPTFFTSGSIQSPFSLRHLNGANPSGAPETLGYRPWMRTLL